MTVLELDSLFTGSVLEQRPSDTDQSRRDNSASGDQGHQDLCTVATVAVPLPG
jgi:hypothetical protein